jgi:hypothetical protein
MWHAAMPSTVMNSRPTLIPLLLISFQPVLDRNAMIWPNTCSLCRFRNWLIGEEGLFARPRSPRSRTRPASRCSPRASTCAGKPPCSRRRGSSRRDYGYSMSIGEAPRHVCSKANRGLIFRGSSAPTYSARGGHPTRTPIECQNVQSLNAFLRIGSG